MWKKPGTASGSDFTVETLLHQQQCFALYNGQWFECKIVKVSNAGCTVQYSVDGTKERFFKGEVCTRLKLKHGMSNII